MLRIIKNKTYLLLAVTVLWQLISVGLMATGVWPLEVSIANTILLAALFIYLQPKHALGLFLLSLPFMVIFENSFVANLPMWRPLALWLFVVVVAKYIIVNWGNLGAAIKLTWKKKSAWWDKWLIALLVLAVLSLITATFPEHGAKQVIFLVNTIVIYATALLVLNTREDKSLLVNYLKASLMFTVALGFIQYGLTLFSEAYYFWQYWSQLVMGTYYGQPLAEVLGYSNSWFSSDAGNRSLRMFGILQDTHAFAVIAIFAIGVWIAGLKFDDGVKTAKQLFAKQSAWFWVGLVLFCFAIVASGTRGVWVSMLIPFAISIWLIVWYRAKLLLSVQAFAYTLVIVLFILSPFITAGLNWVRTVNLDDSFLGRATSIYDLKESSNAGRLEIWQSSLKFAATHPLGTGYGNFISSITDVRPGMTYEEAASQKNEELNLPEKFVTAHSLYLHLLVEIGIVGVLLFIGLAFVWVKRIWLYMVDNKFALNKNNLVIAGLVMAVVWLLAYGLFDVTILNERVLLYLMTVLAIINVSLKETNKNIA